MRDFFKILSYFQNNDKNCQFRVERRGNVLLSVESSGYYLIHMFEGKTLWESIAIKTK